VRGQYGLEERDSDFKDERAQVFARLATLQRLREEMKKNNRQAMLKNIEELMAAEARVLGKLQETPDGKPSA
jgi:hypothetical protein